jgi:hypothetical protein
MATAKLRVGGAWVDTQAEGSVRVGGLWVPFGPGGAPAYESLAWPAPPAGTDFVDAGEAYHMGIRFSMTTGKPCYGTEWRVPDTVEAPPLGDHYFTLWRVSDEALLASKAFVPTPGLTQQVLWDSLVNLDPLTFYVSAVYTRHYVFRTGSGNLPVLSPSGNVTADEGRLTGNNAGTPTYPAPAFNALYYVAPLMGV